MYDAAPTTLRSAIAAELRRQLHPVYEQMGGDRAGIMACECCQQLCGALHAVACETLEGMRALAKEHTGDRGGGWQRTFAVGLTSTLYWDDETKRHMAARVRELNPCCDALYQQSLKMMVRELHADERGRVDLEVLPFAEFVHSFMRNLSRAPDVRRGIHFEFASTDGRVRAHSVAAFRGALATAVHGRTRTFSFAIEGGDADTIPSSPASPAISAGSRAISPSPSPSRGLGAIARPSSSSSSSSSSISSSSSANDSLPIIHPGDSVSQVGAATAPESEEFRFAATRGAQPRWRSCGGGYGGEEGRSRSSAANGTHVLTRGALELHAHDPEPVTSVASQPWTRTTRSGRYSSGSGSAGSEL